MQTRSAVNTTAREALQDKPGRSTLPKSGTHMVENSSEMSSMPIVNSENAISNHRLADVS